jgi:hypothetical protein
MTCSDDPPRHHPFRPHLPSDHPSRQTLLALLSSSSFLCRPRSGFVVDACSVQETSFFVIGKIVKSLSLWGPLWGMGKVTSAGKELLAVSILMAAVLQPSSVLTDGGAEFFLRLTRLLMANKIIFIDQQRPGETTSRAWLSSIVSARLLFVGAEGGRRGLLQRRGTLAKSIPWHPDVTFPQGHPRHQK